MGDHEAPDEPLSETIKRRLHIGQAEECHDQPKLTAEEWAYIQSVSKGDES